MLNAVRTIRSVYVVVAGQSGKRALTVEEQEATVSSNVNLDYGEFKFSTTPEKYSERGVSWPDNRRIRW